MKLNYTTGNGRISVELEGNTVKELFKHLSEFQEIFDEKNCGACKSDDVYYRVRTVDGNDYFEMACRACGAKLAYGQHKTGGGLFPKRKKQDGSYDYINKGWYKWNGNSQSNANSNGNSAGSSMGGAQPSQ